MAGAIDSEMLLSSVYPTTSGLGSTKKNNSASDPFSSVLNQLQQSAQAGGNKKKYPDLSNGSSQVRSALKRVVQAVADNGSEDSVKKAAEYLEGLTTPNREDAKKALEYLAALLNGETTSTEGTAQDYLNGILVDAGTSSGSEDNSGILNQLDRLLEDLKNNGATSSQILAQILPLLDSLNQNITGQQQADADLYPPSQSGVVNIGDANSYFGMRPGELAESLRQVVNVSNGLNPDGSAIVPEEPVLPPEPVMPEPEEPIDPDMSVDPDAPLDGSEEVTPPVVEEPGEETDPVPEENETEPTIPEGEVEVLSYAGTNSATAKLLAENRVSSLALGNRFKDVSDEVAALGSTGQAPADGAFLNMNANGVPSLDQQLLPAMTQEAYSLRSGQSSQMVLRLNPANLGEVTVRLTSSQGQVAVTIAAQSADTQKLLESRLSQLISGLENSGVSVKEAKVVQASAGSDNAGLNLSQQNAQSQSQQNFQGHNGRGLTESEFLAYNGRRVTAVRVEDEAEEIQSNKQIHSDYQYQGGNRLWRMV